VTGEVRVIPLQGIPELEEGDDLAGLLVEAAGRAGGLEAGDVLVVAQKAVSKVEGRVVDLELACIRATFACCGPLLATGAHLFLNIHPAVLGKGYLMPVLDAGVAAAGLLAAQVVLEITEQHSLGSTESVARECAALRERGFAFALDDVGVAYSHLTHIDAIGPSYVKVSHAFGSAYEHDATRTRIVRNVLSLARDFGCELVLEGVESAETRDAARAEGIRFAQGYLFGHPAPARAYV